jgi:hypothetical protein
VATAVARIVALLHKVESKDSALGASILALVDLEDAEAALQSQSEFSLLDFIEHWWWSPSVMGALPKFQGYVV